MNRAENSRRERSDPVKKLQRRVRRLERKNGRLEEQNERLREQNRVLKLQLEEYRQKLFKKHKGKDEDQEDKPPRRPKKRGAPKGHPGTTRKRPDRVDEHVDVRLKQCPDCRGKDLRPCRRFEDHYQEDIVIPRVKVTRFRHHYYWCRDCKKAVYGVGKGELPGSYIGPTAKSAACFLHYQMRLSYRQIRRVFRELLGLSFVPSSAPGFDRQIRIRGDPIYEKIKGSLSSKPFAHVDETGWRMEGVNHWLWCFAAIGAVVYLIDRSRGGEVVTSVLGRKYGGVLISDFLAAYNRIKSRKQRCLIHLLRLIKKWQVYFAEDRKRRRYFRELKGLVKSILALSERRAKKRPRDFVLRKADLVGRLRRKLHQELGHPKADKFRRKLSERIEELVTCLDFDEVCSHNNWVERLLRGNVIMRKITFGNRSHNGVRNHEVLMSLTETARLHGLDPLRFLRLILTDPAAATTAVLRPTPGAR
jgi:transposase